MAGYSYVPNPQFRAQQDAYQQKKSQQMASYQNRLLQQESSFRANGPAPAKPMPAYRPAPAPGKQPYGSYQPTPQLNLSGYGQQQTSYGPGGLRPAIPNMRNDPPGAIENAMARYNESKRRREDYLSRSPNPRNSDQFTGTDAEWDEWRGGGYDEVNRQYTPGAAQPNMPPSQGTPYGGWQRAPQLASPGARSIQGAPGKRSAVVGDMGIFEDQVGTEAFERAIAQDAPQFPAGMNDPEYRKWRSQQVVTADYRGPEGEAARERSIYEQWLRGETGRNPTPQNTSEQGQPASPSTRQPQSVSLPVPTDTGDWNWFHPALPRPTDPGDWSRPEPSVGTPPRPQPVYPPDFEGPLPGPPKSREDEIYDQLMAGNFGASLKGIPSAQGRRAQNARETARRIVASENAAATSTDRRAKPTYERALRQYGIRPPAGGLPTPPPAPPEEPDPVFGGTPYQPGGSMPNWGAPGAAQPSMPPSQGTPYGERKWGGSQPSPQGGYQQGGNPVAQLGDMYQQQMLAWQMPKQQLLNWGQQMQQVPWNASPTPQAPYSLDVTGQFGNTQQDMWNNIGGFIQAVNNQSMRKPVGTYLGEGNPGAQYGKQNYDIRSLINQGNQMVQGGWQNPFAQQGGVAAWEAAGRPGMEGRAGAMVPGIASDGTRFGSISESAAYDKWMKSQSPFMQGGAAQSQWQTAPWSLQTGPAWLG